MRNSRRRRRYTRPPEMWEYCLWAINFALVAATVCIVAIVAGVL